LEAAVALDLGPDLIRLGELADQEEAMPERKIKQTYPEGHDAANLCIGMLLDDLDDPLLMRRLPPRSGFGNAGDSLLGVECHYATNSDKGSEASFALSALLTFGLSKKKSEVITIEDDALHVAILDSGISLSDYIKRLADNDECQEYLKHVYGRDIDVRHTFLITELYSFVDAKVRTETGQWSQKAGN
jgi:hypothetical protein